MAIDYKALVEDQKPRLTECSGCYATIWWVITPRGKKMCLDAIGPTQYEPHFATCPYADKFRRSK